MYTLYLASQAEVPSKVSSILIYEDLKREGKMIQVYLNIILFVVTFKIFLLL